MNDKNKNFTQSGESKIPQGSRNVTDFLPEIFKTTTNKKFLQSTLEHLMSSGTTETIDTYWGKISGSNYKYKKDFYNKENSVLRQNHQFTPGFSANYDDTELNVSYINIINQLTNLGYNTSDIDKLLSEHGYVLDVPINLDMFVNYTSYFWFQQEILTCVIEPTSSNPIDIDDIVKLNSYTTPVLENGKTLTFYNGMRVKFTESNASSTSGDYFVDHTYIVEGVGTGKITLIWQKTDKDKTKFPRQVPYTPYFPSEWDADDWEQYDYDYSTPLNFQKEYVVMNRNSSDKNAWSRKNQWVSIYAIQETALYNDIVVSKMTTPDFIARRPIIEFKPDIELTDSGTELRFIIDHHINDATPDDINGTTFYNNNGKIIEGAYLDEFDNVDIPGDIVLFTTEGYYGNVYEVTYNDTVDYTDMQLTLLFNIDDFNIGDKFFIYHSNDSTYIANELYWDGTTIIKGQQTLSRSDSPLFELYDYTGTLLSEYESSTFYGNKIFNYKTSSSVVKDSELNISAITDSTSPREYIYEFPIFTETYNKNSVNNISYPIVGDYFFKNINTNELQSMWKPTSTIQRPLVNETFIIDSDEQLVHEIAPIDNIDEYILYVNDSNAIFVQRQENYTTKTKNQNLYFKRNKNYTINLLNNDDFTITDPYGNTPSNVTITSSSDSIIVNIDDLYSYDILHYSSLNDGFSGYIFIQEDTPNFIVKHNGTELQEAVDFINNNNIITITKTLELGDVIEFNYISDDITRPRDVSPLFKHNPDNYEITDAKISYLKNHFIDQLKNIPNNTVGLGENNYHKTTKEIANGGTIKQQIYSPKVHSILSSRDEFEPLSLISKISYDYTIFKDIFKRKVFQLWNTNSYDTTEEIVNAALSSINVGKSANSQYAHSDMVYYENPAIQTIPITDDSNQFTLPTAINKRGTKYTHVYAWLYQYVDDSYKWVPLERDRDFYIEFNSLFLTNSAELNGGIPAQLKIHIHSPDSHSFVPPSPVKLGFTNQYDVRVLDNKIQLHDGSTHEMKSSEIFDMNSPDFDVVSAALYDLEIRIINNINVTENITDIIDFLPRKILNDFDYDLLNDSLLTDFYNWKTEFGKKENILDSEYNPFNKFTWNYSSVGDGHASYKMIYKNLFGTFTPDITPWEILGYNQKPDWWDTYYSWTDTTKRTALINAIKNGIANSPEESSVIVNPKYAVIDYDWDNDILVTTDGILNDPVTAGIVSDPATEERNKPFSFGDLMYQDEIEWTNSSDYVFSTIKAVMKIKPYRIHETYWKIADIVDLNILPYKYEVFGETYARTSPRSLNMHLYKPQLNEVIDTKIINSGIGYDDNDIDIQAPLTSRNSQATFDFELLNNSVNVVQITDSGFGYQSNFDLISNTANNTALIRATVSTCIPRPVFGLNAIAIELYNNEYGDLESILLSSVTNSIIHLGGYSKKDLINLHIDNSYRKTNVSIPKEDFDIVINENPLVKNVYYSGIKFQKTPEGYIMIDGYNPSDKKFYIYPVNVYGKSRSILIGNGYNVNHYINHSNIIQEIPYKTVFKKKQELYNFLIGLNEYYKKIGFENIDWDDSAQGVILWSIIDESDNAILYENGIKLNKLIYNQGDFGIVKEIRDSKTYRNYAVDINSSLIDPKKLVVLRNDTNTEIFTKSGGSDIYGIELSVVSYEHIIKVKNQTRFGDIIYDTTFGIERDRLKITGERTRNWNGKISSNGFIVRDKDIIKNYDTSVREIENDILNSRNKSIDTLSRKTDKFTVGYQEKLYFSQSGMNPFTSYDFNKGSRKYKGTRLGIDAFINNENIIVSSNSHAISEEWMINTTAFGDYSYYQPVQFEIPPSSVKSNPQIVRFGKNNVEDKYDNIIDIVENDNNYISGDFDNLVPLLPVKNSTLNTKEQALQFGDHLKTAGMPLIDEVDYTVNNLSDMETVYDLNADYANVPEWSSNVSYDQGDIVRVGENVYQLKVPSTGLSFIPDQNTIRGNVTFPVVESGTTLNLMVSVDGSDELFPIPSIQFRNTGIETVTQAVRVTGTSANPTINSGELIQIDNTFVNFPDNAGSTTFEDIVVAGTVDSPTFPGNQGDILIIDGVEIIMSNISSTSNNIKFGPSVLANVLSVGNLSDATTIAEERLATIVELYKEYPSVDWGFFISGYFTGQYQYIGLNIEYLKEQRDLLSGDEDYYQKLIELIDNDVDIVNAIQGTSYTSADDFSTSPAVDDLNATITLVGSSVDLITVAQYINDGNDELLYGTVSSDVNTSNTIAFTAVVTRINTVLRNNDIFNVTASTDNNKLTITKSVTNSSTTLTIGNSSLNSVAGISSGTYGGNNQQNTTTYEYNINEIVQIINNAGLLNVRAVISTDETGNYITLISSNSVLQIGAVGNPIALGFSVGTYEAETSSQEVVQDLRISEIISQINNRAAGFGIVASNVNNAVLLQFDTEQFVILDSSTALESLGFQSGSFSTTTIVQNTFNEDEWNKIEDPINFSVWVQNNLDSFSSNISRQSGYNVYSIFDLEYAIDEICAGEFEGDDALVKLQKTHNYSAGDFVVITGSNCSPNIDGIHKITSIINDTSFLIEEYIEEKGLGGKALSLLPVKFTTTEELNRISNTEKYYSNGLGWKSGMYAYVDSHENTNIPAVYRCAYDAYNGKIYFNLYRLRGKTVDNSKIKNATVYNYKTGEITKQLEVFDPIKGIIPGIVDKEIDIKSFYDSAIYTNSTDVNENVTYSDYWADERVGTVWWNLSNAVYLDYEQSTLEYKQENWGKLYPTSTIDIYEWTKSPVLPDEYDDAVLSGTVIDGIPLTGTPFFAFDEYDNVNYYWTEETKFNKQKSITETYYYFWVKNKITIPNSDRNYSVSILENILREPNKYDIIWIAGVATDSFLVSNLEGCMQCENSVLQITFDKSDTLTHKEYLLLSENDTDTLIPDNLHKSFSESISQIYKHEYTLPYGIWNSGFNYKQNQVVKYNDKFYLSIRPNKNVTPVPPTQSNGYRVFDSTWYELTDYELIDNQDWNIKKYGYVWDGNKWDDSLWDRTFDTIISNIDGDIKFYTEIKIPNYNIHPVVRYNTHTFAGKTMFSNINEARRTFIQKINQLLKTINLEIEFENWQSVIEKDFSVNDGIYNLKNYFVYSDWMSELYNSSFAISYTADSYDDLLSYTPTEGQYAKILDYYSDNRPKTRIYMYDGNAWNLVFHQNATIQFVDELWNPNEYISGWDNSYWDVESFDDNNGVYIREILDICRNYLFNSQYNYMYNDLWFTMLNYIHSEQNFVDWAIKSTYIKMIIEKELEQNKTFSVNNFDSLIDFINDNKPFKTKLREMVDKNTINETLSVDVTSEYYIQVTRNVSGSTEDENTLNYIISTNNYNTIDQSLTTSLADDIFAEDTTIEVLDGTVMDFAPNPYGIIWINGEKIKYDSIQGNVLLNCVRGFENTAPNSYGINTVVFNGSFEEETYEDASFRYIL